MIRFLRVIPVVLLIFSVSGALWGQKTWRLDASGVMQEPKAGHFKMGHAGPEGKEIQVNSLYLTRGGKPVLPVMGELHFSRIGRDQWEDVILKTKANGVTVISTYLFWNQHEEIEGQFDWEGEKDIRSFVKLCARHGMDVIVRLGPWSHGEARNGGTPDWILRKKYIRDRSNDVVYQNYVKRYFGEIAAQLSGLYYKDGGPVIGIQLENEYWYGKAGEAHIKWLKDLTLSLGIDVPLYTVTGWGNGSVPPFEVIPLWGAYADAPWAEHTGKIFQPGNYRFDSFRDNKNIGNERADSTGTYMSYDLYPYFTCEMGIGIQNTWHRRPVIGSIDGLAMMVAKLGSGSNLAGYYIFAGATQFRGQLHSTEEEQEETGYWSRVPLKSYDFQAAVRESGELSKAYQEVKKLHYFIAEAGENLASMMPVIFPAGDDDFQLAVRAGDRSAFLFGINYARYLPKKTRKDVRFEIKLKHETVTFPSEGISIPDSAVFIWPVNYELEGIRMKYATAQLLGKSGNCFVFFQNRKIPVEVALEAAGVEKVTAVNGRVVTNDGLTVIKDVIPGKDCVVTARLKDGRTVKLSILSEEEANYGWMLDRHGKKEFFISDAGMYADKGEIAVFSTKADMKVSRLTTGRERLYADTILSVAVPRNPAVQIRPQPLLGGAKWLKASGFGEIPPAQQRFHRFFLKEFSLDNPSPFRKATLYIYPESGCRINLNDTWVRQPVKGGQLNVIDLTGYVSKGENRLCLDFPWTSGIKRFAARMDVEYSNYDRLKFLTGESWLMTDMYTNPTPMKQLEGLARPEVLTAPDVADTLSSAGVREWQIAVPQGAFDGLNQLYLKIRYTGDRAELFNGFMLSADHFNDNQIWTIGLRRQERKAEGRTLDLRIHQASPEQKIFFDIPPGPDAFENPRILGFKAVPEYKIMLDY